MTLPDNTNQIIAAMEGWVYDAKVKYSHWKSPDVLNGERWHMFLPDYRNSLDAIEPVLARLCQGYELRHMPLWETDETGTCLEYGVITVACEIYWADTLAYAMCAAVLATRDTEAEGA